MKSALGKKRRDGKNAPLKPLTTIQRLHVLKLVEKYGDDYQVGCEFLFISELLNPFGVFSFGISCTHCFAEHVYGHKAEFNAAFSWNSGETMQKIPLA